MKLTCAATAALLLCLGASPVRAQQQTPAQRAEQLNNEGKDFFRDKNYAAAANKFRQAAVLSPEGRFYFNLCYTLDKMGNLRDALMACEAVEPNGASIPLQDKTNELMVAIRQKLGNSGEPDQPPPGGGGTGDPDQPPPGGGTGDPDQPPPGGGTGFQGDPPPPGGGPVIEEPAPAPDEYAWSLGAEIGGVANNLGDPGYYEDGGVIIKLFLNFVLARQQRIGLQGYMHISEIGDGTLGDPLEVFDLGGALFKHIPFGGGNFAFTPLGGVHLALMRPTALTEEDTAVALGLRLEGSVAWLLGSYKEHAISASLGFQAYTGGSSGNFAPMDYGLDHGAVNTTFAVGYTYRFSTPFGQSPVFTLE